MYWKLMLPTARQRYRILLVSPKGRLAPWRASHVCTAIARNDYLPLWGYRHHASHAYFTSPGLETAQKMLENLAYSTCRRNTNLRDCSQNPLPFRARLQAIHAFHAICALCSWRAERSASRKNEKVRPRVNSFGAIPRRATVRRSPCSLPQWLAARASPRPSAGASARTAPARRAPAARRGQPRWRSEWTSERPERHPR